MPLHTTETPGHARKLHVATVLGLLALAALTFEARAQEQPKPGPEQKQLEVAVGEWTYEGSGEASPFGPAGKFKGKTSSRMILGGFFLESRLEDKGDTGYIYQAVNLQGYDPVTKTYISYGFENDGRVVSGSTTISGNTWTTTGVRRDASGKGYKTRSVDTYAADGKTGTFTAEYSPDDGTTWLPLWKGITKRVRQ